MGVSSCGTQNFWGKFTYWNILRNFRGIELKKNGPEFGFFWVVQFPYWGCPAQVLLFYPIIREKKSSINHKTVGIGYTLKCLNWWKEEIHNQHSISLKLFISSIMFGVIHMKCLNRVGMNGAPKTSTEKVDVKVFWKNLYGNRYLQLDPLTKSIWKPTSTTRHFVKMYMETYIYN